MRDQPQIKSFTMLLANGEFQVTTDYLDVLAADPYAVFVNDDIEQVNALNTYIAASADDILYDPHFEFIQEN